MKYVSVLSGILIASVPLFAMEKQIEPKENQVVLMSSDKTAFKIDIAIAQQFPYLENAFSNGMQESINKTLQTELPKEELGILVHYLTLIGKTKIANEHEIKQSSEENRKPSLKNIKNSVLDDFKMQTEIINQHGSCLFDCADRWLIDDLSEPLISYFLYLIQNHEEVSFDNDNLSDSLSSGFDALQKKDFSKLSTNEIFQRYLPLIPELTNPLVPSMQEHFLGYIPFETEQQLTQKSSVCVALHFDNKFNKLIITNPEAIFTLGKQKQSKFDTTVSTISTVKKSIYNPHIQQIYVGTQQGMIKPFNLTNYRFGDLITTGKKAILALALHKKVLMSGGNDNILRCHNPLSNKLIQSYQIKHCPVYAMDFVNNQNDLVFGSEQNCGFLDIEHEQQPKRYFRPTKERNQTNYAVKAIAPYDDNTFFFNLGNRLMLFDSRCEQDSLKLNGHTRTILSILPLSNCKKVISGGYDQKVRIWDLRTQRCLQTIANNSPITCMTFDDNKKELFIGDFNGIVKQYGLSNDPLHLLSIYKKTVIKKKEKSELVEN
jgi:WD40 repeat protein